jgi:hypothetical protein
MVDQDLAKVQNWTNDLARTAAFRQVLVLTVSWFDRVARQASSLTAGKDSGGGAAAGGISEANAAVQYTGELLRSEPHHSCRQNSLETTDYRPTVVLRSRQNAVCELAG